MNELKSIENRVMASNCVGYLSPMAAMHCKKYNGQDIANMYQRIGYTDPLILRAPNPLAYGSFNLYPSETILSQYCSKVMNNVDMYVTTNLDQPLYNQYPDFNISSNTQHREIYYGLVLHNIDYNKKLVEDIAYQDKIRDVLKSISTGYNDPETGISYESPFKDYPFKDALATYVCDKFLSVIKDPINPNEFMNTGYFGIAVGLGARYDLAKIEKLIQSIDPKKAGVPMDNINAAKEFLKSTEFYKELMATNRYLATISTMNVMFNKSDLTRSFLYTSNSSPFVKACGDMITQRKTIQPTKYLGFMKGISTLYCKTLETSDRTSYTSQEDERQLISLVNNLVPTKNQ